MARSSLRHWLGRLTTFRTSRRRTAVPNWPRVEVLKGRWVPGTVTNLNDAGAGSLRQAILDTPAGGTVDFQARPARHHLGLPARNPQALDRPPGFQSYPLHLRENVRCPVSPCTWTGPTPRYCWRG